MDHRCRRISSWAKVVGIACLLSGATPATHGANVLLVTDPASLGDPANPLAFDQELVDMLEAAGHTVVNKDDRADVTTFASAFRNGPPTAEQLDGIDVILMSRGANSGEYDDGTEPDDWNALEVPLVLLTAYQARTSRWGWIDSTVVVNAAPAPESFDPFPDPDHPFVAGRSTSVFPPNDVIDYINSLSVPAGSTIVATLTIGADVTPAIVDIPKGTQLFNNVQGVASVAGERRVMYQMLDYVDNDDIFKITENGFQILHQIIQTLAAPGEPGPDGPVVLQGDCNNDGGLNVTDVVCLVGTLFPGFDLLSRVAPDLPCSADSGNVAVLDVSGNGVIDVADITGLADSLFGLATPGAPPCQPVDAASGCDANPGCQ